MREIYSSPTKLKQLAGFAGSALLSGSMIFSGAGTSVSTGGSVKDSYPASAWGKCDPDLWKHVHGKDVDGVPGPDRLQIIEPCKTVFGTITDIQIKEDGDKHILLKPDPFEFIVIFDSRFEGNDKFQDGNLVTELMCAFPPRDRNVAAEGVCDDFQQQFDIKVGDHVKVSGSYVYDINKDHENGAKWLEIHPITSIEKIK